MQESLDGTSRALRKNTEKKLCGTAVTEGKGEYSKHVLKVVCVVVSYCFLWLWSSATLRMVFTGKLGEFSF